MQVLPENVELIGRISVGMNLSYKTFPTSSKVKCRVSVVDEFRNPLVLDLISISYSIVERISEINSPIESISSSQSANSSFFEIRILLPDVEGRYFCVISGQAVNSKIYILPLIVPVSVFNTTGHNLVSSLKVVRPIVLRDGILIHINEDYGCSIGSHIYDCSFVLVNFLASYFSINSIDSSRTVILELGAGCGLVSLWLAKVGFSVVSTDRSDTLSILRDNVCQNELGDSIASLELNWGKNSICEECWKLLCSKSFAMVVAGDVFYEKDAIYLLVDTIFEFLNKMLSMNRSGNTVFLAQKMRKQTDNAGIFLDAISIKNVTESMQIIAVEVQEICSVRIWQITSKEI